MATHSSIPASRIPWTEEFHGLAGYSPWARKESDMTEQLTLSPQNISKSVIKNFVREWLLSVQTTMILSIVFSVLCFCSSASSSPSPRLGGGGVFLHHGGFQILTSVHSIHLQGQAPGMHSTQTTPMLCLHPSPGALLPDPPLTCHLYNLVEAGMRPQGWTFKALSIGGDEGSKSEARKTNRKKS